MNYTHYSFEFGLHNSKHVIWIKFPYNPLLKKELRDQFPSAKWSNTHKSWYIEDSDKTREALLLPPKQIGIQLKPKIHTNNQQALDKFIQQLQLKAYSKNTIKVYVSEFSKLLVLLKDKPVATMTPEKLKAYFLYLVNNEKIKERQLNGRINAIKFYFEQVLHKPKMFFDIPRPKKPQTLPKMLSRHEIKRLFEQVKNIKHLLMLQLCYGMGLRVSEVVGVKISHIDSARMQVLIEAAKGKKDRYVHLPASILELLRTYYKQYRPVEYLFEGQSGGQYSTKSVQAVFKNALKKANITKRIGVHGLRHSYATHLLEQGTDISIIKELLGHQSIKTTQLYTHVSKAHIHTIKSPLDTL